MIIILFMIPFSYQIYLKNRSYIQPAQSPTPMKNDCVRGGCSGELCLAPDQTHVRSACVYREQYGCLTYSACERQKDEKCGWTQNQKYLDCLSQYSNNSLPSSQ